MFDREEIKFCAKNDSINAFQAFGVFRMNERDKYLLLSGFNDSIRFIVGEHGNDPEIRSTFYALKFFKYLVKLIKKSIDDSKPSDAVENPQRRCG